MIPLDLIFGFIILTISGSVYLAIENILIPKLDARIRDHESAEIDENAVENV